MVAPASANNHTNNSTLHTSVLNQLCPCFVNAGVEVSSVDRLNLLQLAPGGHLGRFVIFTKSAFDRLDKIFGKYCVSTCSISICTVLGVVRL